MMRTLVRLAIVAFAACAAAKPAGAQMEGRYELAEVDGQPLPAASPDEDGVTMHRTVLRLTAKGRFHIQAWASVDGSADPVKEEMEGTWSVTDDQLTMLPAEAKGEPPMRFRFTLTEGTLRLVNGMGQEFTFRARP